MSEPTTPLMMQYHAIKARIRTPCCSSALAISTNCSTKTRSSPRASSNHPHLAQPRKGPAHSHVRRSVPRRRRLHCAPDPRRFKIAICDQMEQPGPGKKLVRREVVRVITPGTATDVALLDARENNFLASVAKHPSGSPTA